MQARIASAGRPVAALCRTVATLCAAMAVSLPCFVPGPAHGQEATVPKPSVEEIAAEDLRARLERLDGATDIDESTRGKMRQLYEQALAELDGVRKREESVAELGRQARLAPERLAELRRALGELPEKPLALPPEDARRKELEQALAQARDKLTKAKEALARWEAEPKRRAGRRNEIPAELSTAAAQLEQTIRQLAALDAQPDPTPLAIAEKALLLARHKAIRQQITALEREQAAYETTAELVPLERDLAAAEAARAEEAVERISAALEARLQEEAAQKAELARIEAAEAHPLLKPLADENQRMAERSEELVAAIRRTSDELEQTQEELEALRKQFTRTEEKVKAVGLTNAIGLLLRKQRADLPDVSDYEREISKRQPEIRSVKLELFEKEDRRSELATLDRQTQKVLERIGTPERMPPEDWELAIRDLLSSERELLDGLIRNCNAYFDVLVDLDNAQTQLIRQAEEYSDFVTERVLWTRSTSLPDAATIRHGAGAILWLASGSNWSAVGATLVDDARSNPLAVSLGALLLVLWIYEQRPMRRRITKVGTLAAQPGFYRLLPSIQALTLTLLVSALWPGVMAFVAWRLRGALPDSDFVKAVAGGLSTTAAFFFPLEFFRQVCRPRGLAELHFGWPSGGVRVIRVNLRWLALTGMPALFVAATFLAQSDERYENSLGRLAFVVFMLLLAACAHHLLRPGGDLYRHLLADRREGWFYRFRHVWYGLATLVPAGLAALAVAGFFYTAAQLGLRLRQTLIVPLVLAVAGAILSRWVLVVRRRLSIEQARRRRASQAEPAGTGTEGSQIAAMAATAEPGVDLTRVSAQVQTLIESSLAVVAFLAVWWIWVDVLPALNVLDRVPLWPTTVQAAETIKAPDGTVTVKTVERLGSITLADLLAAVLIFLMTFVAASNIPGFLEILIPQKLPIDAGARYAIATITRYGITIVGLILGCAMMGISWSKLQWLIAAVSVGLGFGLQEIFANFISGLILLFERPIRVGDIVSLDGETGVVSRIQIRATTITNWDRQELIIPNKEFITGRFLNWSLTNPINRVVIKVGVAYGSDTELVTETLRRVLDEHPEVTDDPAPLINFEGFGDSTLDFVIRAYLPNFDKRLRTIHELHMAIDREFRKAGIEIAFPQRDLHLRSVAGLPESWQSGEPGKRREEGPGEDR